MVGAHLLGPAGCDHPSLPHHDDGVRVPHHDVHVVLDEEDRHAALVTEALDVLEQRRPERAIHAGERLVEHEHPRLEHQGPGELEQLPLAARERPRVVARLGREPERLEEVESAVACIALGAAPRRPECREREALPGVPRREEHVVEHRHHGERLRQLERPHHPGADEAVRTSAVDRLAGKAHVAAVSALEAGHDVEERRLPGTVRPDQRGDRPRGDVERRVVDGADAGEPLRHSVHLQQGRSSGGHEASAPPVSRRGPAAGR